MNKLGMIGAGLAALSMGGGMLVTSSASATSTNDVGTVQVDTDPTIDGQEVCVLHDSAVADDSALADAPEGAVALDVDAVGEPIASFDLAPGSTWHSVSIDADGNITTEEGTDADLPADFDTSTGHPAGAMSDTAVESGPIAVSEGDIQLGTCQP